MSGGHVSLSAGGDSLLTIHFEQFSPVEYYCPRILVNLRLSSLFRWTLRLINLDTLKFVSSSVHWTWHNNCGLTITANIIYKTTVETFIYTHTVTWPLSLPENKVCASSCLGRDNDYPTCGSALSPRREERRGRRTGGRGGGEWDKLVLRISLPGSHFIKDNT